MFDVFARYFKYKCSTFSDFGSAPGTSKASLWVSGLHLLVLGVPLEKILGPLKLSEGIFGVGSLPNGRFDAVREQKWRDRKAR